MTFSYAGRPMLASGGVWADTGGTTFAPGANPADLPLPGLQRKPWHGGPSYFNSYYNPQILTDASVFPVFEFYLDVNNDGDAEAEAAFGVMGGIRVTANTNLQTLRNTGLHAMPASGGEYSGTVGAETIGWVLADEADLDYGPGWEPGQGYYELQRFAAALPADGRLRYNSYSVAGLLYFEKDAPTEAAVFVNGGDTLDLSPTPPDNWPQQIIMADLYWYAGQFSSAFDNAEFRGLPASLNARSQNYGWTLDQLRALQYTGEYNLGAKPLWSIIETGHPYTDGVFMLPDGFNGACWNSVIHEACGICLFVHDFPAGEADPAWDAGTRYAFGDNVYYAAGGLNYCAMYGTPVTGTPPPGDPAWQVSTLGVTGLRSNVLAAGMAAQIPATVAAIQALATVINTQTLIWEFSPLLETMLKAPGDGHIYIFAMQAILRTSGTYALTLPPGVTGTTVTVLNESRTISVSGGAFSDSFAAEYTVHIYKIAI